MNISRQIPEKEYGPIVGILAPLQLVNICILGRELAASVQEKLRFLKSTGFGAMVSWERWSGMAHEEDEDEDEWSRFRQ